MKNLNINKIGCIVGIISAVFFLICSVWGVFFSSTELKELHFNLLQLAYPGFDFTFFGYILSLVEAFLYGWLIGAFFVWLHNKICCGSKAE